MTLGLKLYQKSLEFGLKFSIRSYFEKVSSFSHLFNSNLQNSLMASNRYCVDIAKRGTAGCKECKQKIEKGVVRIAKIIPNPFTDSGGDMKQWFHTNCIFSKLSRAKAATKKIECTDDLEGWDELADEHKPEIEKYIEEFSKLLPQKQTSQKKTPPKAKNKTQSDKNTDVIKEDEYSSPTRDDTLRQFRKIVAEIEVVSEYTKKTAILSKFFSNGSDGSGFKGDLYLWVKTLLPMVDKRVYNLQNRQLIKLFSNIFGCSEDEMHEHFEEAKDEAGDIAQTISVFFEDSDSCPPASKSTLYLQEVDKYLNRLSQVSKEAEQTVLLKEIAKKCTSNDLKMFIRLIKHDLRMNAGPKPVLNAIHPTAYTAFQASRNLKDIVSRTLRENEGSSSQDKLTVKSTLMTPVLPMLAMACKSYEDVFKRCPNGFYVEIKYDGERVQLHKQGNTFSYFSRSLKPVMPHKIMNIKDYIPLAFPHGNNLMLDCEILLVNKDGIPLPFGTLNAHKKTEFKDASVCLYVFDCLQFNDENLMNKPLSYRRKLLQENMTPVKGHVQFSEMKEIEEFGELKAIINSVFKQGLEGVVVKAKDSVYEPGKRHWLKIKKDYLKDQMIDSADLVVLGAFYGTGKFGGKKSTFLMGCINNRTGKWCTVTKVHNGLDDDDIKKLQNEEFVMNMKKISKDRDMVPSWLKVHDNMVPDFVVDDPEESVVWEITGAEFTRTEVHTANGISIRFPRVTRKRDDKSWKEATDLEYLEKLFKDSKQTSDIVGLQVIDDVNEDKKPTKILNSNKRSPNIKIEESETPKKKKIKTEPDDTPPKSSKIKIEDSETPKKYKIKKESDDTPPKRVKKRKDDEESDESPPAKKIKEERNSKNSKKSSKPPIKLTFPDLFSGVKLHIPSSVDKSDILTRYFVAYNGCLLENHQQKDATHILLPKDSEDTQTAKGIQKVTVDWLWDSIKLQKLLPASLYQPKAI